MANVFSWFFTSVSQIFAWLFTQQLTPHLSIGGLLVGFAILSLIIKLATFFGPIGGSK